MARTARVDVHLADVEPIASFIARVHAAYALFAKMTAIEAANLPGTAAEGIADLHAAIRLLGQPPPPDDADDDGG